MSWSVGRLRAALLIKGPFGTALNWISSYPNVLGLLILRSVLASVILLGPSTIVMSPWITGSIASLTLLFIIRTSYGHDGTDQMLLIVFIGLAISEIVGTVLTLNAYLWFLAFQSCFSYGTAGFAKASAKGWRDGTYLIGICSTRIYGNTAIGSFLNSKPVLAKWLACLVIVWECSFPLVLLLPLPLALVILGGGVLFHLINSYIMGLNTFLLTFLSTYPAILYFIQTRGW